jgi:hypothetical protein
MSAAAFTAVEALRAEQRSRLGSPMLPRLWRAARGEWQRRRDRAIAQSVYRLGHAGVSADFRTACERR